MSQTTSHIFDQNNSHKRATIGNVYASTPIKPLTKLHSISLSGIDTFSSSSGGRNSQFIQSQIQTKKHKRYTKGKKKGSKNWHVIETDSEYEVKAQKKTLKNKKEKRTVKRKRIIIQSDSEWETESEKLINEPSINTQESILNNHECIQLFEDVYNCTPEKTRDIPNTYEENLHVSPIIESSIRMRLTSKKNDMQDNLLPVNLLSTDTRTLEETDEDEMRFRGNLKTYAQKSLRKPNKNPEQEQEQEQEQENGSSTMGFSINNLYQSDEDEVEIHFKKTLQRIHALISNKSINSWKPPDVPKRTESTVIPPGMTCTRGYWDKNLRKWISYTINSKEEELKGDKHKSKIRKRNTRKRKGKIIASESTISKQRSVYDHLVDEIDIEFETGGQFGTRMTFREFHQKQMIDKIRSSTSSLDT